MKRLIPFAIPLVAVVIATILIVVGSGGSSVPVSTSTLSQAAQLAEDKGYGYDYSCAIYQVPRQVECVGQGRAVLFLVDPQGVPRLEPGQS